MHIALGKTQVKHDENFDDIPAVILDIGLQGSKKTRLCGIYREYKVGVSGLDSKDDSHDNSRV